MIDVYTVVQVIVMIREQDSQQTLLGLQGEPLLHHVFTYNNMISAISVFQVIVLYL